MELDDWKLRANASIIIKTVINSGSENLKEGEQNIYFKPLTEDGTINKLI